MFLKQRTKEIDKHQYINLMFEILKSLILSSFGKLFVLPLIVWNPNEIYFNLAFLFTFISNCQAISGIFFKFILY